jgi:hypothetical protein
MKGSTDQGNGGSSVRKACCCSRCSFVAFIPCCLFLLLGCQAARVDQPLTAELGASDPETQLEFWHTLAQQPVTSNDDAFHGLLLFLDGTDPGPDYAARVAALKDRRLLPRGFDAPAEEAVDRGTLAVALSRALEIRGGVIMSLTGTTPRYATKELIFLGIYPPSSPNQTFSGTEFLGIVGKAEDYQRVARAGTARPLDALRPENDVQGGRDTPPADELVEPAPPTSP